MSEIKQFKLKFLPNYKPINIFDSINVKSTNPKNISKPIMRQLGRGIDYLGKQRQNTVEIDLRANVKHRPHAVNCSSLSSGVVTSVSRT
jgi:hypothetical protein